MILVKKKISDDAFQEELYRKYAEEYKKYRKAGYSKQRAFTLFAQNAREDFNEWGMTKKDKKQYEKKSDDKWRAELKKALEYFKIVW